MIRAASRGKKALVVFLLAALPGCGEGRANPAATRPGKLLGGDDAASGKLYFPRAVAVSGRGEVCVVDRTGRLRWFGPQGGFLFEVTLPEFQKGQPTGINFARSGELLVADSHYQRLLVYGPPPAGGGPPSLERKWGNEGTGDGQFTLVRDVVEDSRGFLYAGDYNGPEDRVQKFTPSGGFVLCFGRRGSGPGELQRPQGLSIERRADGSELLLVADSCNHRVQRFTPEGRFVDAFGRVGDGPGELKFPYGVATAPRGTPGGPAIYVVEWGNNRVQRFDPEGRPTGIWGGPGHHPGELSTPWDVAVGPDGKVYVADSGNHRVQVVEPGAFGTVAAARGD